MMIGFKNNSSSIKIKPLNCAIGKAYSKSMMLFNYLLISLV